MEIAHLVGVVFLIHLLADSAIAEEYQHECTVWQNVSTMLNSRGDINMICSRNQQCTGVNCFGTYKYKDLRSHSHEEDFCFGVALHPCRTPVDLHFYVEALKSNHSFQQDVAGPSEPFNTGIKVDILGGNAEVYMDVSANRTQRRGKKYMQIRMMSKVKVSLLFGVIAQWPPEHQKLLIPTILVPIPDCGSKAMAPDYVPHTCNKPTSTVAPLVTPTPTGVKCTAKNANGSYIANSCGYGEMCIDGYCRCATGYTRVNGSCGAGSSNIIPYIYYDDSDSPGHMNTIIIASCVAAVVFAGLLVLSFFIVKYRQYKARYGNHQPLMNNENSGPDDPLDELAEDDPPLDIST